MSDLSARIANLSPEKRAILAKRLQQQGGAPALPVAEALAVIGIGCQFPGGADSAEAFWKLLVNGVDAISDVPADRWDIDEYFDADASVAGKIAARQGGFLDGVDRFDAQLFGISPREAAQMDPQQRLLLEVAWQALEDAGQSPDRLRGSRTGVFVGAHSHSSDYCWLQFAQPEAMDAFSGTGTAHNFFSGRLSYLLDLHGPSLVVDTACSSSLVAAHLACQSLRAGECTMAIVAGVNLMLTPWFSIAASRMSMLAPDGRCKPFDASANGFTRGEGCGVVVIKRLADAQAAGDRVLAVIRGSAINQDGHTNGITAPNGLSQQAVVREALRASGLDPSHVGYVEAHGTGTPLGDPIEVEALAAVFADARAAGRVIALGSAKSNIGHLEGAAGVAGLIKAVLTVRHGQIPPVVHFRHINPHIPLSDTPFVIPTATTPWVSADGPRVAGVSAFGWSGTNAHIVLEEAPAVESAASTGASGSAQSAPRASLVPISARSREALDALGHAWRGWLRSSEDAPSLLDICHTAAHRRAHHECRAGIVASSVDGVVERIDAWTRSESHPHLVLGQTLGRPGVVFVFPGQGSQWIGMGRELFANEPIFREAIDRCAQAMSQFVEWSLVDQIAGPTSRLDEIDVVQPTLFAVEVALAAMWRSWGVTPDAVVGHSMGEVAAAHVAGALSLEDAARVICLRSRLLRRVSGRGTMAAVELSLDETARAIAGYEARLSIAVSNSPNSTVISGDTDAIQEVLAVLDERDIFCRQIKVDVASHSPQMDPLRDDLVRALAEIRPTSASVPMYSTVTASIIDGHALDAEYWARNLRQPVLLSKAVERLVADGNLTFVEMSPHPILLPAIESGLQATGSDGMVLPSLRREEPERETMLLSAARLYAAGYELDWTALNGPGRFVELPRYQFQRERFWLEAAPAASGAVLQSGPGDHPILSGCLELADGTRVWQFSLDPRRLRYLLDHRLGGSPVLPASVTIEIVLAVCAQVYGSGPVSVRDLELVRPLMLGAEGKPVVLQVSSTPQPDSRADVRVFVVGDGLPRLLVKGLINRLSEEHVPPAVAMSTPETSPSDAARFYEQLERSGVTIGEGLRTVMSVARTSTGAAGVVALGDARAREVSRYRCHPAITDGLLQLIGAAVDQTGGLYVPARIGELRWYGQPTRRVVATVQRADVRTESITLDFHVQDAESASPVLDISGVELRPLEGLAQGAPRKIDDWLYEIEWKAKPAVEQPVVKHPVRRQTWVIFADQAGVGRALADWLGRKGQQVKLVFRGEAYAEEGPDTFRISPESVDDYARVLSGACGASNASCRGVVFLWPAGPVESEGPAAFAAALEDGAGAALRLAQAVSRHDWSDAPRLWFVTCGAHGIDGAMSHAPEQAAIWGLGRVVAEEHRDTFGGLIDLDPAASIDTAALELGSAIWEHAGESEIAWRDGVLRLPRLVRRAAQPPQPVSWRADATYAITGAFGGIGLAVARWAVEQGARRLMLIGRTVLPPRDQWATLAASSAIGKRVAGVCALEAMGASVHLASLDIADAPAVSAFFDGFEREGWPPVRGVFHCAAVTDDRLLDRIDAASLRSVLQPKAVGAWVLHERLRGTLDWFVSFSSLGSLLGQAGQGSYAAANAVLDALSARQRAAGTRAVSINWAGWRGLGFAETAGGQRTVSDLEARGIGSFEAQEGLQALQLALTGGASQVAVVPADWGKYRASRGAAGVTGLLEEVSASTVASPMEKAEGVATFRAALLETEAGRRRDLLERHLQEHLAHVLRLPVSRLDPIKPLGSLGLESLTALEFRNRLEGTLGVKLSATLVWNHPTVRALATYLLTRLDVPVEEQKATVTEPSKPASPVVEDVGRLTEDEALRALLGADN